MKKCGQQNVAKKWPKKIVKTEKCVKNEKIVKNEKNCQK